MNDDRRNFIAGAVSPLTVKCLGSRGDIGKRSQGPEQGDGFRKRSTHPTAAVMAGEADVPEILQDSSSPCCMIRAAILAVGIRRRTLRKPRR